MDKKVGELTVEQFGDLIREHIRETPKTYFADEVRRIIIEEAVAAHKCRYDVTPDDMKETIKFVRSFNIAWTDSKRTIRKTILTIFVAGICGLIALGFYSKIQNMVPK